MIIHRDIPKTWNQFISSKPTPSKELNNFSRWMLEEILESPRYEERMKKRYNDVYRLWNSLYERDGVISYDFKYQFRRIIKKPQEMGEINPEILMIKMEETKMEVDHLKRYLEKEKDAN